MSGPFRLFGRVRHPVVIGSDALLSALASYPLGVPVAESVLRCEMAAAFIHDGAVAYRRVDCISRFTTRHPLVHRDAIAVLPGLITANESIYCAIYRPNSALRRTPIVRGPRRSPLRTGRDHCRAQVRTGQRRRRFAASMLSVHQRPFPHLSLRSITWDQGTEMATHEKVTADLGVTIYFCEPSSPWQRPSNENTYGLLRDYFPKGTDISTHSASDLRRLEDELDRRPRAVLGHRAPADLFASLPASPHPPTVAVTAGNRPVGRGSILGRH